MNYIQEPYPFIKLNNELQPVIGKKVQVAGYWLEEFIEFVEYIGLIELEASMPAGRQESLEAWMLVSGYWLPNA